MEVSSVIEQYVANFFFANLSLFGLFNGKYITL